MAKPYKYQKEDVAAIERFNGRTLLALEMGLGKTLEALLYIKNHPELWPAIIVCPATAKYVWRDEAHKHVQLPSAICSGQIPMRRVPEKVPPLIILNYDILQYWYKFIKKKIQPSLVIFDECHALKTLGAIRTRKAYFLCKKVDHILALSGTPLTNRPKELFPILRILCPDEFFDYNVYAWRYCGMTLMPWGYDDNGATHLDELHKRLRKHCMIRHRKAEVLKFLPPKRRSVVLLDLEKYREYRQAEMNFISWLKKQSPEKARRAKKAENLVKVGYLLRLVAKLKMKLVFDWIDDFLESSEGKLIVFAKHIPVLDAIEKRYKKRLVRVCGKVSAKDRFEAQQRFQKDKKVRIFAGQLVAAGTVLTLTKGTTIAMIEMDYVPGNHVQAEDRAHRIGLKKAVQVYYLIAKGTVEEDLCQIIQKKAKVISAILDGRFKKSKLNVFDMLVEAIRKRRLSNSKKR